MRSVALCFVLVLTLGGAYGALLPNDARRAAQQVPGDTFRGHGRADTNRVLSRALRRAAAKAGGATKPCEDFSVEDLIDVKRVIFAARDPAFERIYAKANDARRLATFGSEADSLPQLERLWAQELALLTIAPHLRDVARDAKCYEVAMWFTHHVPAAAQPDVAQTVALPELPIAHSTSSTLSSSTATRLNQDAREIEVRVEKAAKKASSGCQMAHYFPSSVSTNSSSGVPNFFPTSFSADIVNCNAKTKPVPPLPRDCGLFSTCNNPRGKMWYSYDRMMTRMDMENSGCHQFMGEAAPGHDVLPKNQYTGPGTLITAPTADGTSARYVFWPKLKKCCQCCAEKHGCGIVRPDFMARGNGSFLGHSVFPDDTERRPADVWLVHGGNENYMYLDTVTGLPIGASMNSSADSPMTPFQKLLAKAFSKIMGFNITDSTISRTFYNISTAPINASVFDLPEYCSTKTGLLNQCGGIWCNTLRQNVAEDVGTHSATIVADEVDMRRAKQKVPGNAFRGHGRAGTNHVLSHALRSAVENAGGTTKPCESFNVSELIDVKRVLFAARNPALNDIYAATGDTRRLGTFGVQADNVSQLERLWTEELALLANEPHLSIAARDAKCYEAAMWFTHHVPQAGQADVVQAVTLPELPRKHTSVPDIASRGGSRVRASLKQAMQGCHNAHFLPGTGGLTNSSTVPNWPVTFSADITQCITANKTGTLPPLPHDCGSWSPCNNPRGKMWYDWSSPSTPLWRMDLENSACHQFMGNAAPGHDIIPKNQYSGPGTILTAPTSDGASAKYVFWPELQKCCQCTSEKHGGGVLRPDVMVRGNATYEGKHFLHGDATRRLANTWFVQGGGLNYFYMDPTTGLPIGWLMNNTAPETPLTRAMESFVEKVLHINMTQFVEIRTFYNVSTEPIDSQVFTLPTYCKTKPGILNQCGGEWCALLRTAKA